jgi:hypothetical protein
MSLDLPWYKVQLRINVDPFEEGRRSVSDFLEDLTLRSYYRNPRVSWDPTSQSLVVVVETEGTDPTTTKRGLEEELLEIAAGVLRDFKKVHVQVLDITPVG